MSIEEAKRRLRREIAERRRRVGPSRRAEAGDAVMRHVLAWPGLRPARRVVLHSALPDEVPTQELMHTLLHRGHPVLLPRPGALDILEFAVVHDPAALVEGRFGALEPPIHELAMPLAEDDLVLLPGVAFDRFGRRLGRGGGWYDRSLPRGVRDLFGIAYAFQIVDDVPVMAWDRRVRGVFTESGLRSCDPTDDTREASADPS